MRPCRVQVLRQCLGQRPFRSCCAQVVGLDAGSCQSESCSRRCMCVRGRRSEGWEGVASCGRRGEGLRGVSVSRSASEPGFCLERLRRLAVEFSQAARRARADGKSKRNISQLAHMQGDITTGRSDELASTHPTALRWPASSRGLTATPGRQLGRRWLTQTLHHSRSTEPYVR